jgi:uncharacterized oxidoreductase
MNILNKTVLITGGGSGIGFQIAKLLTEKGNKVIITGRSEARLKAAAAKLDNVDIFAGDITKEEDISKLVSFLNQQYPTLDILINNAGQAFIYKLAAETPAFENASAEILTNYSSVIRLIDKLLPLLKTQKEAAIVNVTSVLAIAPSYDVPTYSASKAALHSYTQALRFSLAGSDPSIKVFELMPPLVDTEFSAEIGGSNGIPASQVAEELLNGLENNIEEIHVGFTAQFYDAYLKSPADAFKMLNARR